MTPPASDNAAHPQQFSSTPRPARPLARRRVRLIAGAAGLLVGALALTACGGDAKASDDSKNGKGTDASAAKDASTLKITISAKDGSTNASINDVAVKAEGGKLSDVTMTEAQGGKAVPGTLAADGLSWKPTGKIDRGVQYKITATGGRQGPPGARNAPFTTVSAKNSFIGNFTPEDGSTVGVGMPVSINFDKAITNKKDVQAKITVTASSGQEVVGHWFGSQRLDFRPEDYWKAGLQRHHEDGPGRRRGRQRRLPASRRRRSPSTSAATRSPRSTRTPTP